MQKTNGTGDRKIVAVIFDMDNTLFDFVEAKLRACKAVVELVGEHDELELIEYFLVHKKGIENLENIEDYLRDRKLYTKKCYEKCCAVYQQVKIANIQAYEGVRETLEGLKKTGLKLAVVTDADAANAHARLEKTELEQYFEVFISTDVTGKRKPEPDSIALAAARLGAKAEQTMLVGDSLRRDIGPGRKLGMVTVYAAYGDRNFFEKRAVEADYVVNDIRELLNII